MKIDFRKIEVKDIEGNNSTVDIAKEGLMNILKSPRYGIMGVHELKYYNLKMEFYGVQLGNNI